MDQLNKILKKGLEVIVFNLDKDYNYLYFNQSHANKMYEIWGVNIERGKCMLDYIKSESDRQKARENFDKALTGKDFKLIEEYGLEELSREFYENVYTPIYDDKNEIIGLSVFVTNVSDQKRRELRLTRSENRFRSIIESTFEAIMAISIESIKVIYANPAAIKLFGYKEEEFKTLDMSNLLSEENSIDSINRIFNNFSEDSKQQNHVKFKNSKGEIIITQLKVSDVNINDQDCKLCYITDITGKVESNKQLEFKDKLIDSVQQAIISTDLNFDIEYWNRGAEQLYGWKSEEVLGKSVLELIPTSKSKTKASKIFEKTSSGKSYNGELLVKGKKGNGFKVLLTNHPVIDSLNQVQAIVSISTDISDKIEFERELLDSEKKYLSVLSSMKEGLVVQDKKDKIIFANESAAKILGLTMDQLLGRDSYDPRWKALREDGQPFSPEDHPSQITLKTGKPCDNVIMNIYVGDNKRRIISINSSPILSENNEISGVVASFSDISKEKEAMFKLKENEERLKNISDSIPGAVLRYKLNTDETEELLFLSKGAKDIWGISSEEAIKDVSKIWDATFDEDKEGLRISIFNSARQLSYWNHEWRIKAQNGEFKWLNGRGTPFKSKDGSVIWDTLILDITEQKILNKKLDENQKLLESINQNLSEGIYRSNESGVIYVNNAFLKMFKYNSLEELQELEPPSIYYDAKKRTELINKLNDQGFFQNEEIEFVRKDGSVFIGLISSTIYKDEKGNSFWDGAIRDISDEVNANLKARENEQLLNSINTNINEALYRSISRKGLVYVNEEFIRMFGYDNEEDIRNADPKNLYKYSSDREQLGDELIQNGSYINREVQFRRKDGSDFWGAISSIMTTGEDGTIYFDGAIRDITIQKKAEESLKDQAAMQDLLRSISSRFINLSLEEVDQSIDLALKELGEYAEVDRAFVFDMDHEIESVSNTYEWCKNGIEAQKDDLQDVPFEGFIVLTEKLVKGENCVISKTSLMPNSQTKDNLLAQDIKSLIAVPIMSETKCIGLVGFSSVKKEKNFGNKEVYLLSMFSDLLLNIKNKAQKQYEVNRLLDTTNDQNKRLKEFSFMTSHNIRSSVSNLMGLTKLILEDPDDKKLIELLHKTASKLDTTIKNINQIVNLENSFQVKEMVECNIKETIERVLELNKKMVEEKNIVVSIDVPESLELKAIPAFIDSIFYNLISNAFKYGITRNSKTIEIWSSENENEVKIFVKDMGWGMNLERDKDKLFKLGSRLHESSDGQGLGLYMTKHQVLELGGKIDLESEPNVGTIFTLTFPKENISAITQ